MLILGFLAVVVMGLFGAGFVAIRVIEVLSVVAIVALAAVGLGALTLGGVIGLIAGLILQATVTANMPLLSVAGGLAVALLVTLGTLRRMLWEIRTAKERLSRWGRGKQPATPKLPSQPS
ncbi:MAG: hypothetical protein ACP5RC_11560 [Halothiobacillaceae bacterium]